MAIQGLAVGYLVLADQSGHRGHAGRARSLEIVGRIAPPAAVDAAPRIVAGHPLTTLEAQLEKGVDQAGRGIHDFGMSVAPAGGSDLGWPVRNRDVLKRFRI